MKRILASLAVIGALAASCTNSSTPRAAEGDQAPVVSQTTVAWNGSHYRWIGPKTYQNLAIYIIASDHHDETDFLTLDEGLKENLVVISEKASAQVNELEIENTSSKPLDVQVGDRLKGGRQDRIVGLSFVVPPHSGKQPVRSFCVEHDRWHAITSVRFGSTENGALAPQNVRASAMSGDQGEVWKGVAAQKSQASASLGAPNTNSSLNETLDSDAAKKASQTYVDALAGALQGTDDAVGIAFAVNGEVTEVDIYPGRSLLAKLYPRLLASYAYQAATTKKDAASAAVTVADVIRFLDDGDARSRRHDQVSGNECDIVDFDKKIMSRDAYDGHVIMNVTGK